MKPRTTTGARIKFPFVFQKNGRTGRIKKWGSEKFGTYFVFAGQKKRNSFGSFERALTYLEHEFSKIDSDAANSLALHPLNSDVRTYSELEQLLRLEGGGATLREAVTFFLANHRGKRFQPASFDDCSTAFLKAQRAKNVSVGQIETLAKHYRRFSTSFGQRSVHEITALEVETWLGSRADERDGSPWSAKTRNSVRGSLVSLSLYAQNVLRAVPDNGKTEFQRILISKADHRQEVEIYTPAELTLLLFAAVETEVDLIPALVLGSFAGLRPFEFHAEGLKRPPLQWEALNWRDKLIHVRGQKVRTKATRDIPIQPLVESWLEPFRKLEGAVWNHRHAHGKKWIALRKETGVKSIYDGLRHSYASYRIRQLKGNLAQLRLRAAMKQTASARLYRRLQAVFLAGEGHSATQVAAITGASARSIQYWCATWRRSKARRRPQKALEEKPRLGRHPLVPALDRARLLDELANDPLALGYAATNWTVPLLATHLQRQGCPITARTLRRRLHAAGLRWKRPRFVFAEPAPHVAQKKGRSCGR